MLWKYILFCVGGAFLQLAQVNYPKSRQEIGSGHATAVEFEHPWVFVGMKLAVSVLAVCSVVAEIWIGVHIFSLWPGLFIFILPTVVVGWLTRIKIFFLKALALGIGLTALGGLLLLGV